MNASTHKNTTSMMLHPFRACIHLRTRLHVHISCLRRATHAHVCVRAYANICMSAVQEAYLRSPHRSNSHAAVAAVFFGRGHCGARNGVVLLLLPPPVAGRGPCVKPAGTGIRTALVSHCRANSSHNTSASQGRMSSRTASA